MPSLTDIYVVASKLIDSFLNGICENYNNEVTVFKAKFKNYIQSLNLFMQQWQLLLL